MAKAHAGMPSAETSTVCQQRSERLSAPKMDLRISGVKTLMP